MKSPKTEITDPIKCAALNFLLNIPYFKQFATLGNFHFTLKVENHILYIYDEYLPLYITVGRVFVRDVRYDGALNGLAFTLYVNGQYYKHAEVPFTYDMVDALDEFIEGVEYAYFRLTGSVDDAGNFKMLLLSLGNEFFTSKPKEGTAVTRFSEGLEHIILNKIPVEVRYSPREDKNAEVKIYDVLDSPYMFSSTLISNNSSPTKEELGELEEIFGKLSENGFTSQKIKSTSTAYSIKTFEPDEDIYTNLKSFSQMMEDGIGNDFSFGDTEGFQTSATEQTGGWVLATAKGSDGYFNGVGSDYMLFPDGRVMKFHGTTNGKHRVYTSIRDKFTYEPAYGDPHNAVHNCMKWGVLVRDISSIFSTHYFFVEYFYPFVKNYMKTGALGHAQEAFMSALNSNEVFSKISDEYKKFYISGALRMGENAKVYSIDTNDYKGYLYRPTLINSSSVDAPTEEE